MKHSLLERPLWQRSGQFHPVLWDYNDFGFGYYPMKEKNIIKIRKSNYKFKEGKRHMHLSNR